MELPALDVKRGRDVFERSRERWQPLVDAHGGGSIFLGVEWLASWARAQPAERPLFLALLERDGRTVAGLPLTLARGKIGRLALDKLEIAGAPWFDQIEVPAESDADREAFLRALFPWCRRELAGWTALALRELPSGGPTARAAQSIGRELGLPFDVRICSRAPYVELASLSAGDAALSKNLRSQLRRSAKKLEALGRLEACFEMPEPARVSALLAECAQVERASWKGRTKSGALQPDTGFAFFADLCPRLARERRFAIGSLRIDGALVAYHWGFVEGPRFLSYNLAQRPAEDALGPGTYLLHAMVGAARGLGIAVMDASRGSLTRPHALARYGGAVREHVELVAYNDNAAGRVAGIAKRRLAPALRRLVQRFSERNSLP